MTRRRPRQRTAREIEQRWRAWWVASISLFVVTVFLPEPFWQILGGASWFAFARATYWHGRQDQLRLSGELTIGVLERVQAIRDQRSAGVILPREQPGGRP